MQQFELERIVNLSEFEQIVMGARVDVIYLKKALKDENHEASNHLVEQLDLKLHRMEDFEFQIERRTVRKSRAFKPKNKSAITVKMGEAEITHDDDVISVSAPRIIIQESDHIYSTRQCPVRGLLHRKVTLNKLIEGRREGDHMYISPFWCGVAAAILMEVVGLIIYASVDDMKKKRRK